MLADGSAEQQRLENAQVLLANLQLELRAAAEAADPDTRIRFNYDWLRRDLELIRRGIQAQIDSLGCAPAKARCVRGDYRR